MDVKLLIDKLESLKYNDYPIIRLVERDIVRMAVNDWAMAEQFKITEQQKEVEKIIAVLEAKCKTYEAIIRNSNFAPALLKEEGVNE